MSRPNLINGIDSDSESDKKEDISDSDAKNTKHKKSKKKPKKKANTDSDSDSDAKNTKPKKSKKKSKKKKKNIEQDSDSDGDKEPLPEEAKNQSDVMIALVNKLHNIMRKHGITGHDAYHDIMRMLFLRFIQPHLDGRLKTLMDPQIYQDNPNYHTRLLYYVDYTNLLKESASDEHCGEILNKLWKVIFATHPFTKRIFPKKEFFKCDTIVIHECLSIICSVMTEIDFDQLSSDIKGEIYENYVNNYSTQGKEFGQYFTPRPVIKKIMELNDKLFGKQLSEHKNISIYDPCMGTAGFLTEAIKYLKSHNIPISIDNVHGNEVISETFVSGLMNILLTTGDVANLVCRDSFPFNLNKKYTWICTNPPFGLKGYKYKEVLKKYEFDTELTDNSQGVDMDDLYPIATNDGAALFLQHCLNKLAERGICNIVLPDGQIMTGKNFMKIRKYLITKFNLVAIMNIPNGAFEHAGVKTAVLFITTGRTKEVSFYNYDIKSTEITHICNVDIDDIEDKDYALGSRYYKPVDMKIMDPSVVVRTIDDVCILEMGERITKSSCENKEQLYPVYGGGDKTFTTDKYNRNNVTCKIGRFGVSVHNIISVITEKYWLNDSGFTIKSANEDILLTSYLVYYLLSRKSEIYELARGAGQKNLDMDEFKLFNVTVPSLEKQKWIIQACNTINKSKQLAKKQVELHTKIAQDYYDGVVKSSLIRNTEIKTLGELCDISSGKFNSKDRSDDGAYPMYTGKAYNPDGLCDDYCFDYTKYIIMTKDGGSGDGIYGDNIGLGKVFLAKGKSAATSHQLCIVPTDESKIKVEYLFCVLRSVKNNIMDMASYTTGLGGIKISDIKNIQIHVPSIGEQQEIISKFDKIYTVIREQEEIYDTNDSLIVHHTNS